MISPDARIVPSVRGTSIEIGDGTVVEMFAVLRAVGGSGDIRIGRRCQIGPGCVLYSGNGITLGDDVLIGPGTKMVPANHAFGDPRMTIRQQRFMPSRGGVVIEDDVLVNANCVLLDGTHIESGAVVTAGSVVSGRLLARTLYAGNPVRPVKRVDWS